VSSRLRNQALNLAHQPISVVPLENELHVRRAFQHPQLYRLGRSPKAFVVRDGTQEFRIVITSCEQVLDSPAENENIAPLIPE